MILCVCILIWSSENREANCLVCNKVLSFDSFDSVRKLNDHVSGPMHVKNERKTRNSAISAAVEAFLASNTSRDNYRNAWRTHLTRKQLHSLFKGFTPEHPIAYSTFGKIASLLRLRKPSQIFCACPICFKLDERITDAQVNTHLALKDARLQAFQDEINNPQIMVVTADYSSNVAEYAPIVTMVSVRSTKSWVLLSFVVYVTNDSLLYFDYVTES